MPFFFTSLFALCGRWPAWKRPLTRRHHRAQPGAFLFCVRPPSVIFTVHLTLNPTEAQKTSFLSLVWFLCSSVIESNMFSFGQQNAIPIDRTRLLSIELPAKGKSSHGEMKTTQGAQKLLAVKMIGFDKMLRVVSLRRGRARARVCVCVCVCVCAQFYNLCTGKREAETEDSLIALWTPLAVHVRL